MAGEVDPNEGAPTQPVMDPAEVPAAVSPGEGRESRHEVGDESPDGAGGRSDRPGRGPHIDEQDDPRVTRGMLDRWEWWLLAAFALSSMAALGPLLFKGRVLTGSDGLYPPDQLQYLTWIRQAGEHWLIGNEFDFRADNRAFLHPGFLISGLVYKFTGLSLQASYLAVWKPVAVLLVFFGFRQYVRALVPAGWPARVALFLALFAVMPWSAIFKQAGASPQRMYTFDFISGEMWTGQMLLGYLMTAVAVGLMPFVLLGVEKVREGGGWGLLAACSLGALTVMWLQPWQGAELLLIIVFVELWRLWRRRVRIDPRLLVVLAAGAAPAVYYAVLGQVDDSWRQASEANRAGAQDLWEWPFWAVALSLAPLALPAAVGLFGGAQRWQSVALRFWPLAVLIVYLQPFGTFPYHSIQGLVLPLAILAVQGFTTRRPSWLPGGRAWWVIPVLFVLTVPGTLHKLRLIRNNIHNVAYPYYIFDGEQEALRFLEDHPAPGGVLTNTYGGVLVPPHSGRESYLGQFSWTPSWDMRATIAEDFFAGRLSPRSARAFIRRSGARFVFQECKGRIQPPLPIGPSFAPLVQSQHDFGCARVYVLKPYSGAVRVGKRVGKAR